MNSVELSLQMNINMEVDVEILIALAQKSQNNGEVFTSKSLLEAGGRVTKWSVSSVIGDCALKHVT